MSYRCVLKAALFVVVTGLCTACGSSSVYQVVTETTYPKLEKQIVQRKFFVVDSQKLPDAKLIDYINKSKWAQFDAKIGYVEDGPTRILLRSIRLLKEQKYMASYQTMRSLSDDKQDCQALILKTDCLHALKADSVDVRARYQQAFDCTSNETVKAIAKTRFRLVNYGR